MNKEKLTELSDAARQAIEDKVFPGCVVGIVYKNGDRTILPFGNFTYEKNSPIVRVDTIYDTASLTKSIVTASLALQLIDEGRLHLNDKLIEYVPEFRNTDRDAVRIKHLLTYTIDGYGLASAFPGINADIFKALHAQDVINILMTHDFAKRPGTSFKYSNIPAGLLGFVIEKITGSTLDVLADERFFKPLRMERSTFFPERFPLAEIAPTEINSWQGLIHGSVHDESAAICKRDGKIVGHAGLFSTAPDILNYLEMLLHDGTYNNTIYFTKGRIIDMSTNQIAEIGEVTGLGFELNQPRYMGRYSTPHTFGKTGFTGTVIVCDIRKGVAYVILSNRTYPHRGVDSSAINSFRKRIGEIILR